MAFERSLAPRAKEEQAETVEAYERFIFGPRGVEPDDGGVNIGALLERTKAGVRTPRAAAKSSEEKYYERWSRKVRTGPRQFGMDCFPWIFESSVFQDSIRL